MKSNNRFSSASILKMSPQFGQNITFEDTDCEIGANCTFFFNFLIPKIFLRFYSPCLSSSCATSQTIVSTGAMRMLKLARGTARGVTSKRTSVIGNLVTTAISVG